jgi:hypothetical protein
MASDTAARARRDTRIQRYKTLSIGHKSTSCRTRSNCQVKLGPVGRLRGRRRVRICVFFLISHALVISRHTLPSVCTRGDSKRSRAETQAHLLSRQQDVNWAR